MFYCTRRIKIVYILISCIFVLACHKNQPDNNIEVIEGVIDIDGNVYKTVKIGDQIWMAENLRVTHYRDGAAIQNLSESEGWDSTTSGAYCYYNDNRNSAIIYGALYNWYALVDQRNISPQGWHVPTDTEWKKLEMHVGMSWFQANYGKTYRGTNEGSKLAGNADLWDDGELESDPAFSISGFNALPAGGILGIGPTSKDRLAWFWSATGSQFAGAAYYRELYWNDSRIVRSVINKKIGISVRLIRD